jgi:hypothetical protein
MRYLSKLIKADSVVLDKPRNLCTPVYPVKKPVTAGPTGAELELLSRAKFEAAELYEQSRKQGVADGFARGFEQGMADGGALKREAAAAATGELEKFQLGLDIEYAQAAQDAGSEALDFAFDLACKILNLQIDREDAAYRNLFEKPDEDWASEPVQAFAEQAYEEQDCEEAEPAAEESEDDITFDQTSAALQRDEADGGSALFADILQLGESERRQLMNTADIRDIVLALKGTGEAMVEAVLSGFPDRLQDTIREELDLAGPVLISDVEKARERIGICISRIRSAKWMDIDGRKGGELFV